LIGTAPNLSFAKIFAVSFPNAPEMTFLRWMMFGLPVSIALFAITFAYLRFRVLGNQKFNFDRSIIAEEAASLGKLSFEEKVVSACFLAFVLLIVTRADLVMGDTVIRGWASRIGVASFVTDGTVSVAVALVLYVIPAKSRDTFLLDSKTINRLPWDIIMLLGGGFALARAFQVSGLSQFLGQKLIVLQDVHPVILLFSICLMISFLTELTSNTATTQVMLPIIAAMSTVLNINPLFIMIPVTITASCAFMLPVATPPNAIVFGTHRLRIADMARVGLPLNILAVITITLMMYVLGRAVFGIDLSAPPTWLGGG